MVENIKEVSEVTVRESRKICMLGSVGILRKMCSEILYLQPWLIWTYYTKSNRMQELN